MVLCVLGVTVTLACRGEDATRPSRSALGRALEEASDLDAEASACVAGRLLASELSDTVLRALADDDNSDLSQEEQTEAGEEIVAADTACAGGS